MTPRKAARRSPVKRFVSSLALAALACLALASPAIALDINPADYFQLTYQPVTFDKTQVAPSEVFHTNIRGRAVCSKNIPLPVSQATITSQVIARSAAGGASYTLNPGFNIDIKPFPDKAGETFDIDQSIALQFPNQAAPGEYEVVWQPVEARAKVSFVWTDISDYFPPERAMGKVTVTAAAPSPPGTAAAPVSPSAAAPAASTTPPAPGFVVPWWAFPLGVLVVVAIIVIVIVLLVRRRR